MAAKKPAKKRTRIPTPKKDIEPHEAMVESVTTASVTAESWYYNETSSLIVVVEVREQGRYVSTVQVRVPCGRTK